jgi:enterochelin esterase-like enzyme
VADHVNDYAPAGMSTPHPGPTVDATDIWFRLRPPTDGINAVRLCQQLSRPRTTELERRRGDGPLWEGRITRPEADRLEYQYELEYTDGSRELTIDPHNPLRAAGPFGEKSVVELPTYEPPAWLDHPGPIGGRFLALKVASDHLGATLDIGLWTSDGLDVEHEAPLLIAHDGPEYDRYSGLLRCCAAMIAADRMPPLRVALLPPVDRNEHYAASPVYARALARELVPLLDWLAPQPPPRVDGRPWRIGMGASLGALATLHAHRRYPGLFGGMFLQSGSFFQAATDGQEAGFFRFDRISAFVAGVMSDRSWRRPVPVTLTCGTVEENLANNRRMRDALALQGYDVGFAEPRDGHNWVAWRDAFDPHLVDLVRRSLA